MTILQTTRASLEEVDSTDEMGLEVTWRPESASFSKLGSRETQLRWIHLHQEDGCQSQEVALNGCIIRYRDRLGQTVIRYNAHTKELYRGGYGIEGLDIGIPQVSFNKIRRALCKALPSENAPLYLGRDMRGYHWLSVKPGVSGLDNLKGYVNRAGEVEDLADPYSPLKAKKRNLVVKATLTMRLHRTLVGSDQCALRYSVDVVPWTFAMTLSEIEYADEDVQVDPRRSRGMEALCEALTVQANL